MRISIDSSDPAYRLLDAFIRSGVKVSIFLDGVDQGPSIITADEKAGFISRPVLDPTGIVMRDENGSLIQEHVYGAVQIRVVEPKAHGPN